MRNGWLEILYYQQFKEFPQHYDTIYRLEIIPWETQGCVKVAQNVTFSGRHAYLETCHYESL